MARNAERNRTAQCPCSAADQTACEHPKCARYQREDEQPDTNAVLMSRKITKASTASAVNR
jgi:hypothetical protein